MEKNTRLGNQPALRLHALQPITRHRASSRPSSKISLLVGGWVTKAWE
jgi:hypothetical protein